MKLKLLVSAVVGACGLLYLLVLRSDVQDATLILLNGVIYTVDSRKPVAEAIALSDGRITGIGSNEEIRRDFRSANIIDLRGKPVYPGLIDAHAHLEGLGAALMNLDLVGTTSPAEVQRMVRERASTTPPGVWIRGRGWDQNDWEEKIFPDHSSLDEAAGEIPVYLKRVDGHAVWVNRKVLEIAGITRDTPDPEGGRIVRNTAGEPTGIFVDRATEMLSAVLPDPSKEERTESVLRAVQSCLRVGLTGVHDMGVDLEMIGIYKELIPDGRLPLRIYAAIDGGGVAWQEYVQKGPEIGLFDGRLSVRSLKLYQDGALGSYGAALIEPYTDDPSTRGLTLTSADSIGYFADACISKGFQLCIHAIGDRANHGVLNSYEEAFKRNNVNSADLRFRIEHAQVLDPADIGRFSLMGVLPVMQPTHCTSDMYWVETRLGPERIPGTYAWHSLVQAGSIVPAGSDFPVESNSPLWGFYAAITRQDHGGWPEGGWHPEERLTREEALKAFTIWAATAAFEENVKGSLEPGKYADLIVLSNDIMKIPPSEILSTTVDLTIVGGQVVYSGGAIASGK